MSKIYVMGRRGSDYRKKVDKWLGNVNLRQAQAVFNYGLQGQKLRDFMDDPRRDRLDMLPILNHRQYGNKYDCVKASEEIGVPAPPSWKYREFIDTEGREPQDDDGLICKPYYSLGGKGIFRFGEEDYQPRTHYLQEEITNRRYELRCIAMSWIDPKDWLFQKRVHEGGGDVLAWNHHNGGKFITVEDPAEPLFQRVREATKKLMLKFNYQFGAADFIIQNPGRRGEKLKHYFIEWNLAPGWTLDRTEEWYKTNFNKLKEMSQEDIEAISDGCFLSDLQEEEEPDNLFGEIDNDHLYDGVDFEAMIRRNNEALQRDREIAQNANDQYGLMLQQTVFIKDMLMANDAFDQYDPRICPECDTAWYVHTDTSPFCGVCGCDLI